MKNNIIFGISVLAGIATFDGICKGFAPATNVVTFIGQKAVAGANGVLAFGLTWAMAQAISECLDKVVETTSEAIHVDINFDVTDDEEAEVIDDGCDK